MSSSPAATGGNRKLLVTLIVIGAILVIAIAAVIVILLGRGGTGLANATGAIATPTPSVTPAAAAAAPAPTQSSAPAAQPTKAPAPPPVDHSTRFTAFNAVTQVKCVRDSDTKPLIRVSWSSVNAVSAWYTANDGDAANDKYMQIPFTGTQDNFTDEHLFDCFHRPSQAYTLTLVAPNGAHISKHWTVTNVGDQ